MNRILRTGALLVFAAMTTACSLKIFEDIGSDPHPPTVVVTGVREYVAPAADSSPAVPTADAGSSRRGRTVIFDSGGLSLVPGQSLQIELKYADPGGDITKFKIRDLDGSNNAEIAPTLTYFAGTSGTLVVPEDGLEITGIAGPHRIQVWAEDSHASRSEEVEFVVTLVF